MRPSSFLALLLLSAATPVAGQRIVSLHPAATEILIDLGAEGHLVARTQDERDDRLAALPSVGGMLTPDLEVLARAAPDLVIAGGSSDRSALSRVVERGGGRVEALGLDRLSDVVPAIRRVGDWVGLASAADSLAEDFEATLRDARAVRGRAVRPRVLWVVWSEPIVLAGPGTLLHDVIEAAGGENAAGRHRAPWPRVGLESLLALDPDVLVWPLDPGLFPVDELSRRAGWRSLAAVASGRVLSVDAERLHDAGPEVARATLELARQLAEWEP